MAVNNECECFHVALTSHHLCISFRLEGNNLVFSGEIFGSVSAPFPFSDKIELLADLV